MRTSKLPSLFLFCTAVLLLPYCKGNTALKLSNGAGGVMAAPGATQVSGKISADEGGYVYLQNMRLSIPAGALEEDTEISAAVEHVTAPAFDGATTVGNGIKFLPEGLQFRKPIEVEFCYAESEIAGKNLNEKSTMVYYAEDNGELVAMSGNVDQGRHCVTGHIEHFSVYIPAAQLQSVGNPLPTVGGANFLPASTTIMAGLPVRVRTTIIDFNAGGVPGTIVSAFLIYCKTGDVTCSLTPATATNKVALQPDTTDGTVTNRYYATIPESFVTLAGFRYRFVAIDNVGGTRQTGIGTRTVTKTPTGLRFNPSAAMNISAGFVRDFVLQANDGTAWRNISADNFSVGGGIGTAARTGPSTVRFAALTAGPGTLNATSGALNTSVAITVQTGMLTHFELMDNNQVIITGPVNVGAGSTYTFDALGYDAYGNNVVIFPTFSTTGGIGAVSTMGVLTASLAPPLSGTVTATLGSVLGMTDTVNVNVYTQPTVVSTNPADGSTGVPVNVPISITFSEPMATSTLTTNTAGVCTGSIQVSVDNFTSCVAMIGTTPTFSMGNTVALVQSASPLTLGGNYQIRILASASTVNGITLASSTVQGFTVTGNISGILDATFGAGGIVHTAISDFPAYGNLSYCRALAIQADGKIIAGGYTFTGYGHYDFTLVRYNPDGSLDSTFGGTGTVITLLSDRESEIYTVAVQADGKIIAAGHGQSDINATRDFALVRYNLDGTLDSTFGTGGIVFTNAGGYGNYIRSMKILADGKIMVGGYAHVGGGTEIALARYNIDGSLDSSFGTFGTIHTPVPNGSAYGYSLEMQSDGKIVMAGFSILSTAPYHNNFCLVRYLANGNLDTTFGIGGIVNTAAGIQYTEGAIGVAIQNDGKILAVGTNGSDGAILRFNTDGTLDSTFGASGLVIVVAGSQFGGGTFTSIKIQADGRIIAGGYEYNDGTVSDFILARLNIDGSIDTSFATNGLQMTNIIAGQFGSSDQMTGMIIQPDGKLLAAGYASGASIGFALVRYSP